MRSSPHDVAETSLVMSWPRSVHCDHWAAAFSSAFAGAGVRGGQLIGQTDKVGAYPASRSFAPDDLAGTIFSALGLDPEAEMRDNLAARTGRRLDLAFGAFPDVTESVRAQVAILRAHPWVRPVPIHGLIFDVETGRLIEAE